MTDVGRTFLITRSQSMVVQLTEADVAEQEHYGDSALESAEIIAGSMPESSWITDDMEVTEMVTTDNVIPLRP